MNKQKLLHIVIGVLLFALLVANFFTIYILISRNDQISKSIHDSVQSEIKNIQIPKPKDGYIPVKGIDYFDGTNGNNATDEQVKKAVNEWFEKNPPQVIAGPKGDTGEKGDKGDKGDSIIGLEGLVTIIRCNTVKNHWEIKYHIEDNWQLLNNERVKCTVEQ